MRAGMTLVELLVVVAIIALLAALLLPAVQAARESARRSQCQNNLRQMGVALQSYHDTHRQLPIGCVEKRTAATPNGRQFAWSAAILPQLELQALAEQIDFDAPYDGAANAAAAATVVGVYLCPSTTRMAMGRDDAIVSAPTTDGYRGAAIDYGGIYGAAQVSPSANGVFLYDRVISLADISDGTSHTLAIAEDSGRGWAGWPQDGEWINGENIYDVGNLPNTQQDNEIWSDHRGGAMVAWCDGSVSLLNNNIELTVLRAACSRSRAD